MGLRKRLEIAGKDSISAALRSSLAQPHREPRAPYRRILFLRGGGIGDMILTLPVLRATRARHPDAQIDVLCRPKNAGPLMGSGLAHHIHTYRKRVHRDAPLVAELRSRHYDFICNLVAYPSFTYGILGRLIGPQAIRVAAAQEKYGYLYNRLIPVPPKQEIHMLARLFLLAGDVAGPNISAIDTPWVKYNHEIEGRARELFELVRSRLSSGRDGAPRLAAVNIAAGLERREWPIDRFQELLRFAVDKYAELIDVWVIITNPRAPEAAIALAQALNTKRVISLPAVDDFRVVMEFLRYLEILITPDTSLSHAASAMGTPVLVLMIGENRITWTPIGVPHQVVASRDPLSLRGMPVAEVLEGLERLLNSPRPL